MPKFWFKLRIDPRGRPFRRTQVFSVPAKSEVEAEFELRRMFRFFSDYHGWSRNYLVKEISRKPIRCH